MTDALNAAIENAMDDLMNITNAEAEGPKPKKARKPKVKPVKTAEEVNASKANPQPVEPYEIDGFAINEDADAAAIQKETDEAREAVEKINSKDADLLPAYLKLGEYAYEIAPLFKSKKIYGQFLAVKIPASQSLDAALRSNCKWLYEALNVQESENSDLLGILGVNRIEDYKSANPTVIRRDYTNAKKQAEAQKVAESEGKTVDELEAEAKAQAKEAAEKRNEDFMAAMLVMAAEAKSKATKEAVASYIADTLQAIILSNSKTTDVMDHIISAWMHPDE